MLLVKAPAKINWVLNITGKRDDGYHSLSMLMQSISLFDELRFSPYDELSLIGRLFLDESSGGSGSFATDSLQFGNDNLVWKAAELLARECGIPCRGKIQIHKYIPFGAGLGGGSADAAAALIGLNHMWKTGLSTQELCELGLRLGADVPFMLHGGLAQVEGIGERVTPLETAAFYELVLVQPCRGISTGKVFSAYDAFPSSASFINMGASLLALQSGKPELLQSCGGNDLQKVAGKQLPEIEKTVQMLYASGASYSAMTGSGCVVFGVFPNGKKASEAAVSLKKTGSPVWLAHTLSKGITFINLEAEKNEQIR